MGKEWILSCDFGATNLKMAPTNLDGTLRTDPVIIPNASLNSLVELQEIFELFSQKYTKEYGQSPSCVAASSGHRSIHRGGGASDVSAGKTALRHWGKQHPVDDLEERLGVPVIFMHDMTAASAAVSVIAPTGRVVAFTLGTYIGAGYLTDSVRDEKVFGFWSRTDKDGNKIEDTLPTSEVMWGSTGPAVSLRYAMAKINSDYGTNYEWPPEIEDDLVRKALPDREEILEALIPLCDDPLKYYRDPMEIFERAEQGDIDAQNVFVELGEHIQYDLRRIHESWPYDTVVIGGGLAEAGKYFAEDVVRAVEKLGAQATFVQHPVALCVAGATVDVVSRVLNQAASPVVAMQR